MECCTHLFGTLIEGLLRSEDGAESLRGRSSMEEGGRLRREARSDQSERAVRQQLVVAQAKARTM